MLAAQIAGCSAALGLGPLLIAHFGTVGAGATMLLACLVIWAAAQVLVGLRVRAAPAAPCIVPALLAAAILFGAPRLGIEPWLACALGLIVFAALAPLVDRSLLRDLQRVFHVKTLLSNP
jgi:hypothetical protein